MTRLRLSVLLPVGAPVIEMKKKVLLVFCINKRNSFFTCTGRGSRPATQSTLASTMATGTLPLREDVSLQTILSSPNEMDDWKRNDLPTDEQALQNALILRSCGNDRTRAWPLLVDPDDQAEIWIRALHEGNA